MVVDEHGKPNRLKPLYDFVAWIYLFFIIDYLTPSFKVSSVDEILNALQFLAYDRGLQSWKAIYFIGHLLTAGSLIAFKIIALVAPKKLTKQKKIT